MIEHEVTIESQIDVPPRVNDETIRSLIAHVLSSENVDQPWMVGIQFVDDPTMQAAHAEFMNIDEPTDIMTFPYADEDDFWEDTQTGGDLIISVDRALANADEAGWSQEDELFFLVTHGLLHLLGWDDASDADRANMLARQHDLLDSWLARP